MVTKAEIEATRDYLTRLFGGQLPASRALHFHERTVRWWCQHGAPPHVLEALMRFENGEISLRWTRALMRDKRSRRTTDGAAAQ